MSDKSKKVSLGPLSDSSSSCFSNSSFEPDEVTSQHAVQRSRLSSISSTDSGFLSSAGPRTPSCNNFFNWDILRFSSPGYSSSKKPNSSSNNTRNSSNIYPPTTTNCYSKSYSTIHEMSDQQAEMSSCNPPPLPPRRAVLRLPAPPPYPSTAVMHLAPVSSRRTDPYSQIKQKSSTLL